MLSVPECRGIALNPGKRFVVPCVPCVLGPAVSTERWRGSFLTARWFDPLRCSPGAHQSQGELPARSSFPSYSHQLAHMDRSKPGGKQPI